MFPMRRRLLVRICSLQTVCWVAVAFGIMHWLILPKARSEVFTYSAHQYDLYHIALWHPQDLGLVLAHLDHHTRTLYTTTELTAGIVDILLTLALCFVFLGYVIIKLRLSQKWLKRMMIFPICGAIAEALAATGIIYLLSLNATTSERIILWIRGFGMIGLLAYTGMSLALLYLLFRHFRIFRPRPSPSVNSN